MTKRAALEWFVEREHHFFFFTPTILLTILIALEVRRKYLTAAWGVEAVVIFLAVLKMDERSLPLVQPRPALAVRDSHRAV